MPMSNLCVGTLNDRHRSLGYLWVIIICIVLGGACLGISFVNFSFFYVGVFLIFFGAILSIAYFCTRKRSPEEQLCSRCGNCACCEGVFCVTRPPPHFHDDDVMRYSINEQPDFSMNINHMNTESGAYLYRQHRYADSAPQTSNHWLRKLENEITRLFAQYSFLTQNSRLTNSLQTDYMRLQNEFQKLNSWISREVRPSHQDIMDMRKTLREINRGFKLVHRASMGTQGPSISADMSSPIDTDLAEILQEIPTVHGIIPALPPYQEHDPLSVVDNPVNVHNSTEIEGLSPLHLPAQIPQYFGPELQVAEGQPLSDIRQYSGQSLPTETSAGLLPPPTPQYSESGASDTATPIYEPPPSYEEATSTTV